MNIVNKLLETFGYNNILEKDNWTLKHQYISGMRKWVANIVPSELLKRTIKLGDRENIKSRSLFYSLYLI